MRTKNRPLLGIEIHEHEVRIALVGGRGSSPHVEALAYAPLPPGAVRRGRVTDPGAVAVALRRLLDGEGLSKHRDAVIGIPSGGAVIRNLQVPPVPDPELAGIVAGEVEHYRIVSPGGAHGFLRLHPPSKGKELIPTVVAAAEEPVMTSLREVADRAELNIVAMEPSEFALFRSAISGFGPSPTALILSITETSSDICLVVRGQLWAYRQLDIGTSALLPRSAMSMMAQPLPVGADGGELPVAPPHQAKIDRNAVAALAKELKRSLGYLAREYPEDTDFDSIGVAANDDGLSELPAILSEYLGGDAIGLTAGKGMSLSPRAATALDERGELRFSIPIGLASRELGAMAAVAPPVDLYASERIATKAEANRRSFFVSLGLSGVLAAIGIASYVMLGSQAEGTRKDVQRLQEHASALLRGTDSALQSRASNLAEYKSLRSQGAPLGPLIDAIAMAMPQSVGLTSITIDELRAFRISGESVDEHGATETLRRVQAIPLVLNSRLDSLRHDEELGGYTFSIVGTAVGMDRVQLPNERPIQ